MHNFDKNINHDGDFGRVLIKVAGVEEDIQTNTLSMIKSMEIGRDDPTYRIENEIDGVTHEVNRSTVRDFVAFAAMREGINALEQMEYEDILKQDWLMMNLKTVLSRHQVAPLVAVEKTADAIDADGVDIATRLFNALSSVERKDSHGLTEASNQMTNSPLRWDGILLLGIYAYAESAGLIIRSLDVINIQLRAKLLCGIAKKTSGITYAVDEAYIREGLQYIIELNDGIPDNENLSTSTITGLIYILHALVTAEADYRNKGFMMTAFTVVEAVNTEYVNHIKKVSCE